MGILGNIFKKEASHELLEIDLKNIFNYNLKLVSDITKDNGVNLKTYELYPSRQILGIFDTVSINMFNNNQDEINITFEGKGKDINKLNKFLAQFVKEHGLDDSGNGIIQPFEKQFILNGNWLGRLYMNNNLMWLNQYDTTMSLTLHSGYLNKL